MAVRPLPNKIEAPADAPAEIRDQFEKIQQNFDAIDQNALDLQDDVDDAASGSSSSAAPVDADYIVATANSTLTAERVATAGNATTWDTSVAGQAKVKVKKVITFIHDTGGATMTTGLKAYLYIPWAGTITAWTMFANASGSCKIDIWKEDYADFAAGNLTDADSITNGHEPELTSDLAQQDTDLSDWTTVTVAAGDVLAFNIDSEGGTLARVTLELEITI